MKTAVADLEKEAVILFDLAKGVSGKKSWKEKLSKEDGWDTTLKEATATVLATTGLSNKLSNAILKVQQAKETVQQDAKYFQLDIARWQGTIGPIDTVVHEANVTISEVALMEFIKGEKGSDEKAIAIQCELDKLCGKGVETTEVHDAIFVKAVMVVRECRLIHELRQLGYQGNLHDRSCIRNFAARVWEKHLPVLNARAVFKIFSVVFKDKTTKRAVRKAIYLVGGSKRFERFPRVLVTTSQCFISPHLLLNGYCVKRFLNVS